jgi:hypothetical protein
VRTLLGAHWIQVVPSLFRSDFLSLSSSSGRYRLEGHLPYEWGKLADWPGGLFNTHGMSVDQEGNFYVAEVGNGRAQKFRPRQGANPALLVGKPVYAAWK